MNNDKISIYDRDLIIQQVNAGSNKGLNVQMSDIFSKEWCFTTIILSTISIICFMIYSGMYLITSLTMKDIGIIEDHLVNRDIIAQQIIMVTLSSPYLFFAGLISEIHWLGRIKANGLCILVSLIFLILAVMNSHNYYIYMSLFYGFHTMSINIMTTYACEIYPTRIRDLALGFFLCLSRGGGGFISQILYIYLHQLGTWVPYYSTFVLLFLCVILVFLLPHETCGRPLDQNIYKELDPEECSSTQDEYN
jgi:hypothetical protein